METSFDLFHTVLQGDSGYIYENKGSYFWNFVLYHELGQFRHGTSVVATCFQLSWTKEDA